MTTSSKEGIGGWLAILIFFMLIVRPLDGFLLREQMQAAADNNPNLLANSTGLINTSVFWIIFLIVAAINVYGGLRLYRDRTPGAVRAAIVILWVTVPILVTAVPISVIFLSGTITSGRVALTVGGNIAIAAAWTAYLRRSKRVRQTYGQER